MSNATRGDGMSGGITSVTLPEISVGPEPDLGGALPGNGSYGDPIAGFHQINQQFADGQRAFSEATANRSNEINAQFQAQNEARNAQFQAWADADLARMNDQRAAMFAQPPITGPILPPNFSETAQVSPAAPTAPMPPPAAFGLGGPVAPDGTAVAAPADTPPDQPPPATGDGLSYRGTVLPLGVTTRGDLVPAVPGFLKSIGDGLGFFNRTLNGEASLYDPTTGQVSDEAIASGLALGGLGMTGGFGGVAARAGETVLGAGPVRTTMGQDAVKAAAGPTIASEELTALRTRIQVPERNTVGLGRTDVPGLEAMTFEGLSPAVRREASLPPATPGPIESPGRIPLFRNHAEEDIANQFVTAVDAAGLAPADLAERQLTMRIQNPAGICVVCRQGLRNPDAAPGVLKQLSERYPDLTIRVVVDNPGPQLSGSSDFVIRGGQYVE